MTRKLFNSTAISVGNKFQQKRQRRLNIQCMLCTISSSKDLYNSLISFQVHLYTVIFVEYVLIILDFVEAIEYFYSKIKSYKNIFE